MLVYPCFALYVLQGRSESACRYCDQGQSDYSRCDGLQVPSCSGCDGQVGILEAKGVSQGGEKTVSLHADRRISPELGARGVTFFLCTRLLLHPVGAFTSQLPPHMEDAGAMVNAAKPSKVVNYLARSVSDAWGGRVACSGQSGYGTLAGSFRLLSLSSRRRGSMVLCSREISFARLHADSMYALQSRLTCSSPVISFDRSSLGRGPQAPACTIL